MARYTASPLGLIPDSSSDIKNFRYKSISESASDKDKDTIKQESIFSSSHDMKRAGNDSNSNTPFKYSDLHAEDRYDLSTSNIIKQLSEIKSMKLKYSDFAYCKDFGVYPNNRLIVCRKFTGPIGDDLNRQNGNAPSATVISWFDESSLPVSINFGVEWVEAETSFKTVLNNMGKDLGLEKIGINLGDVASKGNNIIPLPGIFEPFTRQILQNIKVNGQPIIGGNDPTLIPAGQPNLIKEAKQRKLIGDDTSGSGLNGKISVVVKCSWEQKFIAGQDPTNIYYDILRTILHFGGEDASFYMGGGQGMTEIISKFLKALEDPEGFVTSILEGIKSAITKVLEQIKKLVGKFFDDTKIPDNTADEGKEPKEKTAKEIQDEATAQKNKSAKNAADQAAIDKQKNNFLSQLTNLITNLTAGIGQKYKHVLLGIANSLTGAPYTPWHVTIGNPLRPIFCSGDMWTSDVKLTLGPTLAFNDLPSSIDIEFTLTSGRNCGTDEIFRKLSTGEIRFSSSSAPSFYNNNVGDQEKKAPDNGVPVTDGKNEDVSDGLQPSEINAQTKVGSANAVGSVSTNAAQVNPDPYSTPIQTPVQNPANGGFTDEELAAMAKEDAAIMDQAAADQNSRIDKAFSERVDASRAKESADDKLAGTTTVVEGPEEWIVGKKQNSGGVSQQGVRLNWRVENSTTPGSFTAIWDLAEGGTDNATYNNLSAAITNAKYYNESEFDYALENKGLTKI